MDHRTSYGLALSAVGLCTAGLALVAAPATADHAADHAPDHLYALEVFAPHGAPVTRAPCGRRVAVPGMAAATGLPAGTTAAISLEGPFQRISGTGACKVWWVGGYPVAAPFSGRPAVRRGTVVRIVAAAKVAPRTKLVASRIRVRDDAGVGPAEVELAYLTSFTITGGDLVVDEPVTGGCVTPLEEDVWSVQDSGGKAWQLDVAAAREAGEVEPCFAEGDVIEAEFGTEPPAEE